MIDHDRRVRVVWNANAGRKAGLPTHPGLSEEQIADLLRRHGLDRDVVQTSSAEEAAEATDEARARGVDTVVAAGGDGTVSVVATRLLGSDTALGILPLGSVMNVARMLGISRDLEKAAAIIAEGHRQRIDVGFHGDEPFYESANVGMNAAIFREAQRVDEGDYGGLLRAVRVAWRYRPARMRVTMDDGTIRTRAMVVTVSNGPYTGAGFTVAPKALVDDGLLDVTVFRHFSKLTLFRHFASIALGRRAYVPHVRTYRSQRVRIDGRRPLPARADGRDLGTTPVEFTVRQGILCVLAPRPETAEDPVAVTGAPPVPLSQ